MGPPRASSRYAGEAFRTAAALLEMLQERHYPNLATQVDQVADAATALRPTTTLLEQDARVQRFFDQSAVVLRRMSGGAT